MFRDYMLNEMLSKKRSNEFEVARSRASWEDLPEYLRTELILNRLVLRDLERATHYFLEVDQASELRDLPLDESAFPRCPHALTFIEFDGSLHYSYDHIMSGIDCGPKGLRLTPFRQEGGADYRGVLIRTGETVINDNGVLRATDKDVEYDAIFSPWIQAHWFDRRGNAFCVGIERGDWPKTNFIPKGFASEIIGKFLAAKGPAQGSGTVTHTSEEPESWSVEEGEHLRQMYRVTVNLLHFLMAENLLFVKIRPEHRKTYGNVLRDLPKSDRPYRIVSFQAARYVYEERRPAGESGRHVSVRYDVKGFLRHLKDERYGKDEAGNIRTVWVRPHQRGLAAEIYRPKLRVGHIGASVINFDEFYKEANERKEKSA